MQNDGYERLEKFADLEESGQLDNAKAHLQDYDSMFQIDLQEFENSAQFREYLQQHDPAVDKAEAVFIGWILAFLADISMILVQLLRYIHNRLSSKSEG